MACTFVERDKTSGIDRFVDMSKGVTTTGVVTNTEALRSLLLDWRIWSRAPVSVQSSLFVNLRALVQNNVHAELNVLQLRRANLLDHILFMFHNQEYYAPVVAGPLGDLVGCTLCKPPSSAELKVRKFDDDGNMPTHRLC